MHNPKKRIPKVFTKMLSWVLLVAMCLSMTTGLALTADAATTVTDWTATEITLSNADDLIAFSKKIAGGTTFSGQTIKLGADIDLNPGWVASSTAPSNQWGATVEKQFKGTFDGQGHTISGVYLKATANWAGMFGILNGGSTTVKNFSVVNSYFETTALHMGALFGVMQGGTGLIENVYVDAILSSTSTSTSADQDLGGLVGVVRNSKGNVTIRNSVFAGRISCAGQGTTPMGGIVGRVNNTAALTLTNCAFYGTLASSKAEVGGLIGRVDTTGAVTVSGCISAGFQRGVTNQVGSVAGNITSTTTALTVTNTIYTDSYVNATVNSAPFGTGANEAAFASQVASNKYLAINNLSGWIGSNPITDLKALSMLTETTEGEIAADSPWTTTAQLPMPTTLVGRGFVVAPVLARDISWYSDSATEFTLTTPQQLLGLSELIYAGKTFSDKTIKFGNDIDLNPGWTAGVQAPTNLWANVAHKTFLGSVDGQGYTVSGLYLLNDTGIYSIQKTGMFGYVKSAASGTVGSTEDNPILYQNFTLTNSYVRNHSNGGTGSIIGEVRDAHVKMVNVHSDATVFSHIQLSDTRVANTKTGGLVGAMESEAVNASVIMENCSFSGSVSTGLTNGVPLGGLIGIVYQGAKGTAKFVATNCKSTARITSLKTDPGNTADSDEGSCVGGIIGKINKNTANTNAFTITVTDCVADATIQSSLMSDDTNTIGAVVGAHFRSETANLTITGTTYVCYRLVGAHADDDYQSADDPNTKIEAIAISTAEQLLAFAADIASGDSYADKLIILTGDIDLNPGWVVGDSPSKVTKPTNAWPNTTGKEFGGTFDGCGFTISGIYLAGTGANTAIFGNCQTTNGAAIEDLAITNSFVSAPGRASGILFGITSKPVALTNVYVDADLYSTITSATTDHDMGGFIGYTSAATEITGSIFAGTVSVKNSGTSAVRPLAGFVGRVTKTATLSFTDCAFYGTVLNRGNQVGGFVGRANSGATITVDRCVAAGHVQAFNGAATTDEWQGSVIGRVDNATGITIKNTIYSDAYYYDGNSKHYTDSTNKTGLWWDNTTTDGTGFRRAANACGTGDRCVGPGSTVNAVTTDNRHHLDYLAVNAWVGSGASSLLSNAGMTSTWITTDSHPIPAGLKDIAPTIAPAAKPMAEYDLSWYTGHKSDTTYTLTSSGQFLGFMDQIEQGVTFEGKTIKLACDVAINTFVGDETMNVWMQVWTFANENSNAFLGNFDGQGHTISGLYRVNLSEGWTARMGLVFDRVCGNGQTSYISNFTVTDSFMYHAGHGGKGGVVGELTGVNLTMENVSSEATCVFAKSNDQGKMGGILGCVENVAGSSATALTMNNCQYTGTLILSNHGYTAGGLVGRLYNGNSGYTMPVVIKNSASYAVINDVKMTSDAHMGGILGDINTSYTDTLIENCISLPTFSTGASNPNDGTVIGQITSGSTVTIKNSIYDETLPAVGTGSKTEDGNVAVDKATFVGNDAIQTLIDLGFSGFVATADTAPVLGDASLAVATWVGTQSSTVYPDEDKFDLRLLGVVSTLSTDVKNYGFNLYFDDALAGKLTSYYVAPEVTAYNAGQAETVSASEYDGIYFIYVHITGIPTDHGIAFSAETVTTTVDGGTTAGARYEIEAVAYTN